MLMIHFLWVAVAAQGFVETPSRPCETAPEASDTLVWRATRQDTAQPFAVSE